jgi:hypothetical protein
MHSMNLDALAVGYCLARKRGAALRGSGILDGRDDTADARPSEI